MTREDDAASTDSELERERRRRLSASWDRSALAPAELLRLRGRILPNVTGERPRERRRYLQIGYAVMVVLGVSALAGAATRGLHYLRKDRDGARDEPTTAATVKSTSSGDTRRNAAPVTSSEKADVAVPVDPVEGDQLNSSPAETAPATPSAEKSLSRASANNGGRPPNVPSASTAKDPRWTEAADALRRSDMQAAERSLSGLAASSDPATRDAASLTLAELWLRAGQTSRARPVLAKLATRGATPVVRARAADLLKTTR